MSFQIISTEKVPTLFINFLHFHLDQTNLDKFEELLYNEK